MNDIFYRTGNEIGKHLTSEIETIKTDWQTSLDILLKKPRISSSRKQRKRKAFPHLVAIDFQCVGIFFSFPVILEKMVEIYIRKYLECHLNGHVEVSSIFDYVIICWCSHLHV